MDCRWATSDLGLKEADSVKRQDHPVIILYDEAGEAYPHAMVAKIFGQVTTHATQLEPAHKEWLSTASAKANIQE